MEILFDITSSTFGAYYSGISVITFTDLSTIPNIVFRSWDFGDGIFSSEPVVDHQYALTGPYTVTLRLVDIDGSNYTSSQSITAQNYIENAIIFSNVPPPSEQSEKQIYPFRISLSASNTFEHVIDLYSQFSKSSPYLEKDPNRWLDLQPRWRFLDLDGNVINSIKTIDTPIRLNMSDRTSKVVGVTGYADFYYIDDIPTTDPLILWATLQVSAIDFKQEGFPSYANSLVQANIPYYIDTVEPVKLAVTEDLTSPIHSIKWIGGTIPHLITMRGWSVYQLDQGISNFPIIYDFPSKSTYSTNSVQRSIYSSIAQVVSRKYHRVVGPDIDPDVSVPFDINLPLSDAFGIECRSEQNIHHMVFTFIKPISFDVVEITEGIGIIDSVVQQSATIVIVNLREVADAQKIRVTIKNVYDGITTNDISVYMGILVGDVNGDGVVNSGDTTRLNLHLGESTSSTNFRLDLNLSGKIDVIDKQIAQDHAGDQSTFPQYPINYIFDETNNKFIRNSPEGFDIGGYIKSNVKILNCAPAMKEAHLKALLQIKYEGTPRSTPYTWIPNPANATLNRVEFSPPLPDDIKKLLLPPIQSPILHPIIAEVKSYSVPTLTGIDDGIMDTTDYAGIYGVAVDPSFNVWVSDCELDCIYKFDSTGNILKTIKLDAGSAPTSICFDSNLNLYVSCNHQNSSIIKLNSNGDIIGYIIQSHHGFVFQSIVVETDSNDNIWAAFYGTDDSIQSYNYNFIVQFDSEGAYAGRYITLDPDQIPIDIIVDSLDNNSIWVVLAHPSYGMGSVRKYSSNTTLLSAFPISDPYNMAQDLYGGIWVTYTERSSIDRPHQIYHINPNGQTALYSISHSSTTDALDTSLLEGIACDAQNRIWILDSINNVAHVFSQSVDPITKTTVGVLANRFKIIPDTNVEQYLVIPPPSTPTTRTQYALSAVENTSIQAIGDWTGFKWHQKYMGYRPGLVRTKEILGDSAPFNLLEFKNPFDIRRFNESFDITDYIKKLPMPENLATNNVYFDQYLGNAIGGLKTEEQSIGRIMYERAANFVDNHSDIDTCGIDQLYSTAKELDVNLDNYNLSFPPELHRLMDIASISHPRLWGGRSRNANRFIDDFTCCTDCKPVNRGAPLDFYFDYVSAGQPIVVKTKYAEEYALVPVNPLSKDINVYPLSSFHTPELQEPINDYYLFYTYIPTFDNKQVEGIINWGDDYTTLKESNSSIDNWYGDIDIDEDVDFEEDFIDDGILEIMFNYQLHRGLGLIK